MGRRYTKEDVDIHFEQALNYFSEYIEALISDEDFSKVDKLSYWLQDWTNFLKFENTFNPRSLRRYKRGEIIKAHLGFNVGSEEGGLHYCVVIEKNNPLSSPVISVIPLTSVKNDTQLSSLHNGSIYLGNELYTSLYSKVSTFNNRLRKRLSELQDAVEKSKSSDDFSLDIISNEILQCGNEIKTFEKMNKEITKMKQGSIALVNQIRTISKLRIYDPKTNSDVLSNLRLSNEKLDLIDQYIISTYTKG